MVMWDVGSPPIRILPEWLLTICSLTRILIVVDHPFVPPCGAIVNPSAKCGHDDGVEHI